MSVSEKVKFYQGRLVVGPDLVSREAIMRIPNCPPVLQTLFLDMQPRDLSKYIEGVVKMHRMYGQEIDVNGALAYAAEVARNFTEPEHPVSGDFAGGNLPNSLLTLRKGYSLDSQPEEKRGVDLNAAAGVIGGQLHYAVFKLASGQLPSYNLAQAQKSGDQKEISQSIWEGTYVPSDLAYADGVLPDGQIAEWLLSEIASCQLEIAVGLLNVDSMWDLHNEVDRMYSMLRPILGQHLETIARYRNTEFFPTALVNFATAVLTFAPDVLENQQRVILTEIPVLERKIAGRADGLEIIAIGDMGIREYAARFPQRMVQIREIIAEREFISIGHVLATLEDKLGLPVRAIIHEFKSQIGDNPNKRRRKDPIPLPDIIDAPLAAHDKQLRGYIANGNAGYGVARQHDPRNWQQHQRVIGGDVIYAHSGSETLIIHPVLMSYDDQEDHFTKFMAQKYARATHRARDRILLNLLVRNLQDKWQNKRIPEVRSKRRSRKGRTAELALVYTLGDFIDEHRQFGDEARILEIVGEDIEWGGDKYTLHLEALLEERARAESEGHKFNDLFDPKTGGMVCCFLPGHNDRTPSMHINYQGYFHCFGCQRSGVLEMGPIPKTLDKRGRIITRDADGLTIPLSEIEVSQEHLVLMHDVQGILQAELLTNRKAQAYFKAREIDLKLAMKYGAGYCNGSKLLEQLRAKGYTIEQLLHFGILGYSKKGGIYVALDGSVTFPLELQEGQITNFYGRKASDKVDKHKRHTKLDIKESGVPHGLFNIGALNKGGEIIIVEGVFDALALITMGYENVVALIGTHNELITTEIARKAEGIAIGLDNDAVGPGVALAMAESYVRQGYPRNWIRSFTGDFLAEHPECIADKDFAIMLPHLRRLGKI